MAFAPIPKGSALPCPPEGRLSNDPAGFASCYGPHPRSPYYRAFDTGLRPDPFPDRAASLLPGLLTATRTGPTPAGDDELMLEQLLDNYLQLLGALSRVL